ncbi:hypothetical protein ACIBO5_54425 [Nonomuraea angiospora]|uniref:hypothetical protein n=1 Tax=Nonomuraea angiospora TaxID=46172 RepID=UPI0029AAAB1D|nr:hypothetical protein [Nonomuraea angiospora]MDX3099226.1 hypothetical protein [Nonomuraea angiospora]
MTCADSRRWDLDGLFPAGEGVGDQCPAKPGVLAPAQAYHPSAFLDFLVPYGIQWIVDDEPSSVTIGHGV